MDPIEDTLKQILLKDIELPNSYKYTVRNTLKERKKDKVRRLQFTKIILAGCGCLLFTTTVFAFNNKKISHIVTDFFGSSHKGINTAIEHGYIDTPDMEYQTSNNISATLNNKIIDCSDTQIKLKNILMDDLNLDITFSIKVDKNIDISQINEVNFSQMLITDENNAILYSDNKESFENYCKKNNLDYKYSKFNEKYINNEVSYFIKAKSLEDNTIDLVYKLNSSVYHYPKSKKIYINIAEIRMTEKEITESEEFVINGNWNIDFNVPEKFYNRKAIIYDVKNCSDDKINITEICTYNTGTVFEFTSKDKPIYDESDSVEVKNEKFKQFTDMTDSGVTFINNEYIEDRDGNRYYPVEGNVDSSGTIYDSTGDFRHWNTFELTNPDVTDSLTIHLNVYLQGYTRDIVIELERKN